jgi:hypothetical protein
MWQLSGFVNGEADAAKAMQRLASHLVAVPVKYRKFNASELLYPPAAGKWSRQEILGHLIDSAVNNLKRFTDIQFLPQPYQIQTYNQEELVIVNNYNKLPLEHLLGVWEALNRQIMFVVENIPAEKLAYKVNPNYGDNEMRTLEWIIADYVAHLEHHLIQVFGTE